MKNAQLNSGKGFKFGYTIILTVIVFLASLSSCATSTAHGTVVKKNVSGDYYSEKLDIRQLSNGVPVILKQMPSEKTCSVNLVIDGGSAGIPSDLSGLDSVTFTALLRGSEKYSYEQIIRAERESYASLSFFVKNDYVVYSLSCSTSELYKMLDMYSDCFLHPLLKKTDFDSVMTEAAQSFQGTASDPAMILYRNTITAVLKNHPYASFPDVTAESVDSIMLENVKSEYEGFLNANRLHFVIVGDFDSAATESLISFLDKSFGIIPSAAFAAPVISPIDVVGEPLFIPAAKADDKGYIIGCFSAPSLDDGDYIPFALSTLVLDDILSDQIVQKNAAVSVGTGIIPGKRILGVISVYGVSDRQMIGQLLSDAFHHFPSEKELEEKLDRYKNIYINKIYSDMETVSGTASQIIIGMEYCSDPAACFKRSVLVQDVTPQQVAVVYKKYFLDNFIRWAVVSGEKTLHDFSFSR